MTAPGRRRQAERRGRAAETLAALVLWAKGYQVVGRRARTPFGEIDILAVKGPVLAVVEVKARPTREAGLLAITAAARRRLTMAGLAAAQRVRQPGLRLRFDLMIVTGPLSVVHVRDAWRADTTQT